MNISADIGSTPQEYLTTRQPDAPVHFFAPAALHRRARRFLDGFGGLTSFAVKANPDPAVLSNLARAGVRAFDVASPAEIRLVRDLVPDATLHYHNPVRSEQECAFAWTAGVRAFSIDSFAGLEKLARLGDAAKIEVSVRLKLPVGGAAYDFGDKFGADPEQAEQLLRAVRDAGFVASMTFHPGTQCTDPRAWDTYITAAAGISGRAGVRLHRLNVGGGFPAQLAGPAPDLEHFFTTITTATNRAFATRTPALVCEPGRAMVADSFAIATRVKEVRTSGALYLNDGIYGGLSEFPVLPLARAFRVFDAVGQEKTGPTRAVTVFGPTCDSLDVLPQKLPLPVTMTAGDYIVFAGMGAYVTGVTTAFNGYGTLQQVTVVSL